MAALNFKEKLLDKNTNIDQLCQKWNGIPKFALFSVQNVFWLTISSVSKELLLKPQNMLFLYWEQVGLSDKKENYPA